MIKKCAECRLTHSDLASIASRISVDYSKLEFGEDQNSSSSPQSSDSEHAWHDLKLLYDCISLFIEDEPLPF